ncbi:conserved membrane protein of unknown function [Oenococcus oeni]|uniref:hypothetical protein n=1 Tax=Oenococcus oeni TaxID=1247 RepID=UPI00107CC883|nr:hypothetical protein [Oenococcus oeni]AVI94010.1 hypothetical protein AX764_03815 [Oenococcus oeni]SYW00983.1 conserved membrane hypothetical protein [Oenococcus oeni]SYW03763.1 conserved membrane hypothetical protein [Oenococcus oeni]SYW18846.1 conserved membrane hypothetical protein [Oenococcus oeni]VDC14511.1 conserved membrane protein of unknown function [Oenococcus oeni]
MRVNLKNPVTKQLKRTKVGFSWTVFFFGFFTALFRGDWLWFLIIIIADSVTFGVASIVFAFIYNRLFINELLSKGYEGADQSSKDILISKNFTI